MSVEIHRSKPEAANPTYVPQPYNTAGYKSFDQFYSFYLGEHRHPVNRRLHLIGTLLVIALQARAALAMVPLLLAKAGEHSPFFAELSKKTWVKLLALENRWRGVRSLLASAVVTGYAFAWVGHFFFEKNKPATFKHPFYSLRGDYRMLREVLFFQRKP